jgi:cobalt-zinc-cadmium resistance protein CzcA
VLKEIPEARRGQSQSPGNLSTLSVYVKPDRLARYGINSRQVMDAVATFGGRHCGQVFEGRAR